MPTKKKHTLKQTQEHTQLIILIELIISENHLYCITDQNKNLLEIIEKLLSAGIKIILPNPVKKRNNYIHMHNGIK